ncbi:DUF7239 family protein [Micromonospora avicenniae]|uniref:DUF7239 family protein n=1 Tax=Micromonospora avicenniae TaxID=1198245 RepID=UPI0033166945
MPDPREKNLPKWAQSEMARLRRIAEQCEARIAEADARAERARLDTNPKGVNTALDPYGIRDDLVGLGDNVRIRFTLGDGWRDEITARVHPVGGYLEISGSRALVLHPQVSNVINVHIRDN